MSLYKCALSSSLGKRESVIKEAAGESELIASFSKYSGFLISYELLDSKTTVDRKKHFKTNDISAFTDIMATLLNSGLNLQEALSLCELIEDNVKIKYLCKSIGENLKKGISLYSATGVYDSSFSPLYRALIHLGEETGSVGKVFERMSSYLKANKTIKDKILNALLYPLIILVVAIAGCFGIVFFILPKMKTIFSIFNTGEEGDIGVELDSIYNSLILFLIFIIVLILCMAIAIILYKKNENFALLFDTFILKVPVIGKFNSFLQTLNFSFAMEMLTLGGFTVSKALKESTIVATNRAYKNALNSINEKLSKGEMLSSSFLNCKEIPSYVGTWIAVGEKTGKAALVFSQIRQYFQNTIDNSTQRMMNMIEPALILFIGIVIFILVIQFVLPVFALYGKVL